jgi:hypothetical protein
VSTPASRGEAPSDASTSRTVSLASRSAGQRSGAPASDSAGGMTFSRKKRLVVRTVERSRSR